MSRQQGTPAVTLIGSYKPRERTLGFPAGSSIRPREGIETLKPPDTRPATTVRTPVR